MREKPNKQIVLKGEFCALIPIMEKDFEDIIRLRNREKNRYFLNQKINLTLEQQIVWYQDYLGRENDIYWGIWKDCDTFIGTIRIYNIQESECEEGSCIVDEEYAKEAPYAVEAKYLLTKYAFDTLGIDKIVNFNKADNKVMNSLSKRQGFQLIKEVIFEGEKFNYYVLEKQRFEREKIEQMLQYWKAR
mgnify:CR=1 FL=1